MKEHFPNYTRRLVPNARLMRMTMTDSERLLWSFLRGKQLGFKMRRQVPIGRYIVDFLCEEKKLIIELDGGQHFSDEGKARDKIRDDILSTLGYRVVRILNDDVLKDIDSVLMQISSYLQ
jgi:very-short-patch-repair endonuclease